MKNSKDKTKPLDSVDQIRNILFGEQINIIEERFAKLEQSLMQSIDSLAQKLTQSNDALKTQIQASNKQLSSDNTSLAAQHSKDLKSLETTINNKIIETESDLVNQLQTEIQKLDNKASHRNELAKLLKDMANKLSD